MSPHEYLDWVLFFCMSKNLHDLVFKQLMGDQDFSRYFFKTYLPSGLLETGDSALNLTKMRLLDGRHHELKTGKLFESDVIYLAPFLYLKDCFFYLHVEHQSTPDKAMLMRIINYQAAELTAYAKKFPNKTAPGIISFIYYQGVRPWKGTHAGFYTESVDFFFNHDLNRHYFGRPFLIDLFSMSENDILKHYYIGPIELLLKYIRQKSIRKKIEKLMEGLKDINANLKSILLKYVASVLDLS